MLAHAALRPGPGFEPFHVGLYYAQRFATPPIVRTSISRAIASAIRVRHGVGSWAPDAAQAMKVVSDLRENGVAQLDPLATPEMATKIHNYFLGKDVVGPGDSLMNVSELPSGTRMAAYPLRTILENSDILSIVNTPLALRIATEYLGCKPTLSSVGVRWSFPGEGPGCDTQEFHRDPDDWRFLKLFVYLTDVDAGSGPHSYVKRSHLTPGRIRACLYPPSYIEENYGSDAICTIMGPRGTTFMADTYGIHAGNIPTQAPRLIVQIQYSLLPVYSFRYDPPVLDMPPNLDPYVNRLFFREKAAA